MACWSLDYLGAVDDRPHCPVHLWRLGDGMERRMFLRCLHCGVSVLEYGMAYDPTSGALMEAFYLFP